MSQKTGGPTEDVTIAVVGLGRMGAKHARNVAAAPGLRLAGVADDEAGRATALAAELDAPAFTDLGEMLDRTQPAGLVVATPSDTHTHAIEVAAARGVHVLCEKPLATDGPSAARTIEIAAHAGITLQIGFQMRFDRDLARMAAMINAGEIGPLYQLRASLRDVAPPPRSYLEASGGYFWDGAIHCFDLARWLAGEVLEVSAFGTALSDPMFDELGDVDNAIVVLRFASGALGVIDVSRVAGYGFDSGVEVVGAGATLRCPATAIDGLERYEPGRRSVALHQDFMERFDPTYAAEVIAFAQCMATGGEPLVGARDGLAAMRIAESARVSALERRTVGIAEIGW